MTEVIMPYGDRLITLSVPEGKRLAASPLSEAARGARRVVIAAVPDSLPPLPL